MNPISMAMLQLTVAIIALLASLRILNLSLKRRERIKNSSKSYKKSPGVSTWRAQPSISDKDQMEASE